MFINYISTYDDSILQFDEIHSVCTFVNRKEEYLFYGNTIDKRV